MTDHELNSLKTDVALIKHDIKQIETIFKKVDIAVEKMTEIYGKIAVQDAVIQNNNRRISDVETEISKLRDDEMSVHKEIRDKLEDLKISNHVEREAKHKEILKTLETMDSSFNEKIEKQNQRISTLENWKWYLFGIVGTFLFIIPNISDIITFLKAFM